MHDHDHGTSDAAAPGRSRLAIAFGITATVFVAQLIGAIFTNSLALLVDTAHMLTDAGGLLLALVAANLMVRPASQTHTWGLRRAEVLAAAAQSLVLLAVGTYAIVSGIARLFAPAEVPSEGLLVFGILGLVGNIASIAVLATSRNNNLNLRAAFLEVINDALGSVAVIVSAIVIAATGWTTVDTIAGLLIAALILPRAVSILRRSVRVLMEAVPAGLDLDLLRQHLLENDHVRQVHDLHVTSIGTGLPVLTAHIEVEHECLDKAHTETVLRELQECVREHFEVRIEHCTFQLEPGGYGRDESLPHA
ncbi:cation diffusion facilitator family transporter [Gulosibacter sediminis]|uniref:cation diffusion facilitator family transporter n=1 Tax=Gulosibacter sediminis TaxID=1729695 RepID=UPI0024A991C5|nr:cation diffusion facilitator family transporter [Gulosibacter sediminis]